MKVLVTGASRGIGLELCRIYQAELGAKVIAVCRQSSPSLEELRPYKIVSGIDVQHTGSVRHLKEEIAEERVDVLINNAGLMVSEEESQSLEQIADNLDASILMFEKEYQMNTLGPLRVTSVLLDQLSPGAKVILLSSQMASDIGNTVGRYYGYRSSKAAANAMAVSMAHDLKPRGFVVGIVHPGDIDTDVAVHPEASRAVFARIQELTIEDTGHFVDAESGKQLSF